MEIASLFVFLLYVPTKPVSSNGLEDATLSVNERVSFLKFVLQEQLKQQMKGPQLGNKHFLPDNQAEPKILNDNYDYVDLSRVAITPINENDDRKINGRFKLRQLKTIKTTTARQKISRPTQRQKKPFDFAQPTVPQVGPARQLIEDNHNILGQQIVQNQDKKAVRQQGSHEVPLTTPGGNNQLAEFYRLRRRLLSESMRDTPVQWTHCEDLITPYLSGIKSELGPPLVVGPTHRKVLRLVHLTQTNVTKYTKQDIYSLMYQISNIQIRFFTWDPEALRILFMTICQGKKHTFKSIKYGLKKLFKDWHLDFSDSKNLLTQSKVFRPPCITIQPGSTKSSKGTSYTTKGLLKAKGLEKCSDESEHN